MRILLHGQAFWGKSAYCHQIQMALDTLMAQGHTVGQACTFGFQGRKILLGNITLYPMLNDINGQDVIAAHVADFKADYVLSLGDVFMFDPKIWKAIGVPWFAWATVDSAPLWDGIRNALGAAHMPIAYSQYGQRVMMSEGFENAGYIPLAYNPEAFYPAPLVEARDALSLPHDRFIVGMVQANRQKDNRKNFFGQIEAFRKFQLKHPDAWLYLHTCMTSLRGGFDLERLCRELGMTEGRDYGYVNEYVETTVGATDEQMRNTYNSIDVLLQATKAEGFGVPALEASACRKPVVYTDCSALPESVHFGYRVEGDREWQPASSWYTQPRQASIVDALERSYQLAAYDLNKGDPVAYRSDRVAMDYWEPFMQSLTAQPEAMAA